MTKVKETSRLVVSLSDVDRALLIMILCAVIGLSYVLR